MLDSSYPSRPIRATLPSAANVDVVEPTRPPQDDPYGAIPLETALTMSPIPDPQATPQVSVTTEQHPSYRAAGSESFLHEPPRVHTAKQVTLLSSTDWEERLDAHRSGRASRKPMSGPAPMVMDASSFTDTGSPARGITAGFSAGIGQPLYELQDLQVPCPREVSVMQREIDRLVLQLQLGREQRDEQIRVARETAEAEASNRVAELTTSHELERQRSATQIDRLKSENQTMYERLDNLREHSAKIKLLQEENRGLKNKLTEAERGWIALMKQKENEWRAAHDRTRRELADTVSARKSDLTRIEALEDLLKESQDEVRDLQHHKETAPERERGDLRAARLAQAALQQKVDELLQLNKALYSQLDAASHDAAETRLTLEEQRAQTSARLSSVQDEASETVKLYASHIKTLDEQVNSVMAKNSQLVVEVARLRAQLEDQQSAPQNHFAASVDPRRSTSRRQ